MGPQVTRKRGAGQAGAAARYGGARGTVAGPARWHGTVAGPDSTNPYDALFAIRSDALKRTEKEELVGFLADIFNNSQVGFLADYRGLSVADVTDLRRRLHEASTGMRVLKNRIAKIAIKDTPFESMMEDITGTRAFIYGQDAAAQAKVVTKFQGENAKFSLLKGLVVTSEGTSELDVTQIKTLGSLPSRDELVARLLSVLNGPLVGLVSTMKEIPAKFVRILAAVGEQKGGA